MQQGPSTAGVPGKRGRSTAAKVAEMRAAYLAAPRRCLQCEQPILPHRGEKIHETMRRKFCSRSCAASYNNSSAVAPKKKAKTRCCAGCGAQVAANATEGARPLCPSCAESAQRRLPELRRDQVSSAGIRRHVRHVLAGRPRVCAHCGYARHVEAIHLRPIDDFPPDTLLATIDDPANLAYLCPNHRWEHEHGFLTLAAAITTSAQAGCTGIDSRQSQSSGTPRNQKRPLYTAAVASR